MFLGYKDRALIVDFITFMVIPRFGTGHHSLVLYICSLIKLTTPVQSKPRIKADMNDKNQNTCH